MEKEDLNRNFKGYLNTPLLWQNNEVYDLQQCIIEASNSLKFKDEIGNYLRLGKLVERFVSYQLATDSSYEILTENIQIQDGTRTVGEMDALLMTTGGPIHLEIIYKFYLYDPSVGKTELSHWIGPNRKDSLLQKLDKLKNKQLPLLYHPKTQSFLDDFSQDVTKFKQQVLFKAQLFSPFELQDLPFYKLNQECVQGFYIRHEELHRFDMCQFYIPQKINWLMQVHVDVDWMDYQEFFSAVRIWLDEKRSPLCWMKQNGKLHKFFVVWW